MKTSVLLVILGIVVITALCTASESVEQALSVEVSELIKAMDKAPEERDCRWFWGACSHDGDCCAHLGCKRKWPYICLLDPWR
uniref:U15-Theraphotoxin-Ct1a_1 n=1 Tax=Coremiocnemis tropix TaxID=1904443 RepID=A0A482Z7H6_CORTR